MKPTHSTHLIARCILTLAAFCAFGARVEAGPAEDVQRAEVLLRTESDVSAAMSILRKGADQNHAPSQAALADLLHAAEFDQEALVLYRQAAAQGDAGGEFGLGRMYANGTGVPRDRIVALEWYRKAEKKNHAPTLDALARAYRTGDLGLTKDVEQANALDARVQVIRLAEAKSRGQVR